MTNKTKNISLSLIENTAKLCDDLNVPRINHITGQVLSTIVMLKKPKSILEIGSGGGYSLLWMSKTMSDLCTIDSIEIDSDRAKMAKKFIKGANLQKRVNVVCDDALKWIKKQKNNYDLIFIDAKKSHYLAYLKECEPLLSDSGVIIFDDTWYWEKHNQKQNQSKDKNDVVKVLFELKSKQSFKQLHDFLDSNEFYQVSHIHVGNGLTVLQKK